MTTERDRERLECITTNDKVPALINFINTNYPSNYDYPVPDVVSVPVERAHSSYIACYSLFSSVHGSGPSAELSIFGTAKNLLNFNSLSSC